MLAIDFQNATHSSWWNLDQHLRSCFNKRRYSTEQQLLDDLLENFRWHVSWVMRDFTRGWPLRLVIGSDAPGDDSFMMLRGHIPADPSRLHIVADQAQLETFIGHFKPVLQQAMLDGLAELQAAATHISKGEGPERSWSKVHPLHCSFCGTIQYQVGKLITGPKVAICNECVFLCQEIIAEDAKLAKSAA